MWGKIQNASIQQGMTQAGHDSHLVGKAGKLVKRLEGLSLDMGSVLRWPKHCYCSCRLFVFYSCLFFFFIHLTHTLQLRRNEPGPSVQQITFLEYANSVHLHVGQLRRLQSRPLIPVYCDR
ncbi:hypothetical protein EV356DRAFT_225816 [Viridothelium virens]|uniref:Uncharacterized protein n=1 Tax=Viridothelium virens TaxID=1048519 RepID=A0A6A6HLW8_VIRVR|nr:hypothetical protein EV356DRAFT_225816 [Viridothelium virens]